MSSCLRAWFLLLLAPLAARADPRADPLATGVAEFRAAYQAWDGDGLARAVTTLQLACGAAPNRLINHYWLGTAALHQALVRLGEPADHTNRQAAAAALAAAAAALQRALQIDPRHAECHALLSTVYGLSIATKPLRSLWLGPRVLDQENQARQLGPDNPRVLYLLGMNRFYGPALLGGKEEALTLLLAAEARFAAEQPPAAEPLQPRWGRASCLVYTGKTYDALGKPSAATTYYQKALAVDPRCQLAREALRQHQP